MEIGELSKSGNRFSALKLSTLANKHVEITSLQFAFKQKRNDLTIIKIVFLALYKKFKRKNMLKSPTKNIRLKSITATF